MLLFYPPALTDSCPPLSHSSAVEQLLVGLDGLHLLAAVELDPEGRNRCLEHWLLATEVNSRNIAQGADVCLGGIVNQISGRRWRTKDFHSPLEMVLYPWSFFFCLFLQSIFVSGIQWAAHDERVQFDKF